jgi:class 3 adenylate cyclase
MARGESKPSRLTTVPNARSSRIAGILFADVVGFSSLSDIEVVRFHYEFLGAVGRLLALTRNPPIVRNTWGDGLYLIFETVRDAGVFALELCAMIVETDWAALELPSGLTARVGLHAGPLFDFSDRVTGQLTLAGKHVTRAARVEPVTPPGTVYATQEFAALAAAYGVTEFACEPVGRVTLAKKAGVTPLFLVRAARSSSTTREKVRSRRHKGL